MSGTPVAASKEMDYPQLTFAAREFVRTVWKPQTSFDCGSCRTRLTAPSGPKHLKDIHNRLDQFIVCLLPIMIVTDTKHKLVGRAIRRL